MTHLKKIDSFINQKNLFLTRNQLFSLKIPITNQFSIIGSQNRPSTAPHLVVECIDQGVKSVAVVLGVPLDVAVCPAGQDPLDLVVEFAVAPQTPFRN